MRTLSSDGDAVRITGPMHTRSSALRTLFSAALLAMAWLGGCSESPQGTGDNTGPDDKEPAGAPFQSPGLTVSDPIQGPVAGATMGSAAADSAGLPIKPDSVVYVSLGPGTVPRGSRASIRRVGDPHALTTAVIDGGFDPIAVTAQPGDSIAVRIFDAAGTLLLDGQLAVVRAKPPKVVRTQPPPGKTDVPLNAAIVIVFSEPVDPATLTATSIRLLRGSVALDGTSRFLDATHLEVEFVPAAPLSTGTDYRLIVSDQ